MLQLKVSATSDRGLFHLYNNDFHLIDETLSLFVVCDSAGEGAQSRQAAEMGTHFLREFILDNKNIVDQFNQNPSPQSQSAVAQLLTRGVQIASERLHQIRVEREDQDDFYISMDAVLFVGGYAFIAHVGNGRVYQIFNDHIYLLTQDHTYYQELVTLQKKTAHEAARHKFAHALTRAVGYHVELKPDLLEIKLSGNDTFLICTDGLHRYLSQTELLQFYHEHHNHLPTEHLINEAKTKGGKDNLTGLVIQAQTLQKETSPVDTLRRLPLFQYLNAGELQKVVQIGKPKTYQKGEAIIEEGKSADFMALLVSGHVQILKKGQTVAEISAGGMIGQMSLIENIPERAATAIAQSEVQALIFTRGNLYGLFKQNVNISAKFFWSLSRDLAARLRKTTIELVDARKKAEGAVKELPFL